VALTSSLISLLLGTQNPDGSYAPITAAVTSQMIDARGNHEVTIYLEGQGAITGGTVLIEEAARRDFAGTWSQVTSISASGLTGGSQQAVHLTPGCYAFVRVRVSAAIAGGGGLLAFLAMQGT
jgi:hypothetical protein